MSLPAQEVSTFIGENLRLTANSEPGFSKYISGPRSSSMAELPLGWTRISRGKVNHGSVSTTEATVSADNDDHVVNNNKNDDDGGDDSAIEWCCNNPGCHRGPKHNALPSIASTTTDSLTSTNAAFVEINSSDPPLLSSKLQGQAIFCWCEIDATWFQGYFIVAQENNATHQHYEQQSFGLLAEQTLVDDCMACADGGYHEISLKIYSRGDQTRNKPMVVYDGIEWTGGDMMKLRGNVNGSSNTMNTNFPVMFETGTFLTGRKAVPFVEQYFGGLVTKLRDDHTIESSILELMPEVAILVGSMQLSLPRVHDCDS